MYLFCPEINFYMSDFDWLRKTINMISDWPVDLHSANFSTKDNKR